MVVITEFAPAKINLFLQVTGKRGDGYHLLDSLVVFAGVGDQLTFQFDEELKLSIAGLNATTLTEDSDNLVIKAATRLAEAASIIPQAKITLIKNLPVASGIGGGSADAAATLRGLSRLWNLSLTSDELDQIGLSLGADVPVCLRGKPCRMSGIGEILDLAPPLPSTWILLVNPRIGLSTPDVFRNRKEDYSDPMPLATSPRDVKSLAWELWKRKNDLMVSAISLAPVIGDILEAIGQTENCLLSRMSGSGATCFGLYAEETQAMLAATDIAARNPEWWLAAAPVLS